MDNATFFFMLNEISFEIHFIKYTDHVWNDLTKEKYKLQTAIIAIAVSTLGLNLFLPLCDFSSWVLKTFVVKDLNISATTPLVSVDIWLFSASFNFILQFLIDEFNFLKNS